MLRLPAVGVLTTSEVARAPRIGITTLLQREGTIYTVPQRVDGTRAYRREDLRRLLTR